MKKNFRLLGTLLFVLFGALIYFSCNAFSSDDPAKIRVACIGDSITFGYGLDSPAMQSYPTHLQTLLGTGYEVRNFGNSGRGVILKTPRFDGWRAYMKQKSFQDAIAFAPHIVICNLGINDDLEWVKGPQKRAEFVADYTTLIHAFQSLPTKPKVFIWTKLAPIMKGHRSHHSESTPFAFRMREDLETVASKTHVVGLDLFSPMYGVDSLFLPDGIHPNAQGANVIADATYRQILPWISPAKRFIFPWFIGDNMVKTPCESTLVCGVAPGVGNVSARWEKTSQKLPTVPTDSFGRFAISAAPQNIFCDSLILTFNGADTTWIRNIQIGELFLAVGQSNMLFKVYQSTRGQTAFSSLSESAKRDVRILSRLPGFQTDGRSWHLPTVPRAENPDSFFMGHWENLTEGSVQNMSAVAFEFATRRYEKTKIPVGVMTVSVGGASMESLMSASLFSSDRKFDRYFQNEPSFQIPFLPRWTADRMRHNLGGYFAKKPKPIPFPLHYYQPNMIFESQLKALSDLKFSGIVYYQGESNATDFVPLAGMSNLENHTFMNTALIRDYCRYFDVSPAHFLMVQLPKMNRDWKDYRAAQKNACESTGAKLCDIYDLGDLNDVHPRNKAEVGKRLSKLLPVVPLWQDSTPLR